MFIYLFIFPDLYIYIVLYYCYIDIYIYILNVLNPRGITMPMPWPLCPGREHAERAAERGTGGWPCGPCAVATPKARYRDEKFPQIEMMENPRKTTRKPIENSRKGWIDLGFNNNSTSLFGACYTVLNNFIGCGMMWNQLGLQVWKSHWFSPPTLTKWDWVLPVRSLYRKGYLKILESQFIPCWIHSNLKAASHVMNVMKPSCS